MNQKLIRKKKPLDNSLQLLISSQKIHEQLEKVARVLEKHYNDEEITIVMVMKGSFILAADLMRHLSLPVKLEYIQASSYGEKGTKKGELSISSFDSIDLKGKHVLVIDDIFDTGETLSTIIKHIEKKGPKSLYSLVLLSKNVPHHTDYRPDRTLFDIEDHFVVGYGLDYKEYYRGLPDIYAIEI